MRGGGARKAPWVTYRPEIKVLDCTIRDGGLINDHAFGALYAEQIEILVKK